MQCIAMLYCDSSNSNSVPGRDEGSFCVLLPSVGPPEANGVFQMYLIQALYVHHAARL
jgi:hypothetical protein